ncbi:hypothetical protein BpHYR1_037123 [Brachionus plicatilis]|uniref:Uncharacterized protein n=1 Tax=Brachionus plicatilis TaxID=10195 RepID=A0A3M7SYD9_BRAPC|nr:hypothetical protein BpHYR1_037123 [Brachionus plicatilis]
MTKNQGKISLKKKEKVFFSIYTNLIKTNKLFNKELLRKIRFLQILTKDIKIQFINLNNLKTLASNFKTLNLRVINEND